MRRGSFLVFQSLIGLKINWNETNLEAILEKSSFQSLIGLKINWNVINRIRQMGAFEVSIPNRA